MTSARPVIVIGAGPTGLSLAIALGMRGIPVVVVDRYPEVYPLPRAVHLDDEVYRLLYVLGVGEAFAKVTRPTLGLQLLTPSHRLIARFERPPAGPGGLPQANMFDQPVLEAILRERAASLPSVTLYLGWCADAPTQDAEGVRVRIASTEGEERTLTGAWLVGCDGANSKVADVIGADPEDLGFEQRWLVVDMDASETFGGWSGVHQVCDTTRAATFMRVGETRYRWEFQLLEHEQVADFEDRESLRALIDPWCGAIPDGSLTLLRLTAYTFRARVARTWRDGRILIAGDAAHLTPPFIGQGMGAGVRDAVNLGWKLARVCRGASPVLLDSYPLERRPHARAFVAKAVRVGRAMTDGGWVGLLRTTLFPLLARIPGVPHLVLDPAPPPLTGPLVSERWAASLQGRLLPLARRNDGRPLDLEVQGLGLIVLGGVPKDETEPLCRATGATRLQVDADDTDPGTRALALWLQACGVDAVLVRPDLTVLLAGRRAELPSRAQRLLAAHGAWLETKETV